MTLDIQVLAWDRHKNVAALTRLMESQPLPLHEWLYVLMRSVDICNYQNPVYFPTKRWFFLIKCRRLYLVIITVKESHYGMLWYDISVHTQPHVNVETMLIHRRAVVSTQPRRWNEVVSLAGIDQIISVVVFV